MRRLSLRSGRRAHEAEEGQSLVEFALIFPIFILLFIGLIEFAVTFGIMLNVNYASRAAALMAAEVGNRDGADCIILQTLDQSLSGVSNKEEIQEVRIFWAEDDGDEIAANVYVRGGPMLCHYASGVNITVPYELVGAEGYPDTSRCPVLAGCPGHAELDTIGVHVDFHHNWLTPLPGLVQVNPTGLSFTRSNAMRMEPTL